MQANSEYQTASGLAALSICESLLVSLCDQKIMGEKEVVDFSRMLPRLIAMGSLPRRIRKPHHAAAGCHRSHHRGKELGPACGDEGRVG